MKTFKNYTSGILCFLFLQIIQLQTNSEVAAAPKKWFPGHYVDHNPDDYSTTNSDITFLKNADGALFQGMFPNNILTFNPGWDESANLLESFDDVRTIQNQLKSKGIKLENEADETTSHFCCIQGQIRIAKFNICIHF